MKTPREQLERALRGICDDESFVSNVVLQAKTPENWETMLSFIDKAHELGDDVSYEDMVVLSLVLRERLEGLPIATSSRGKGAKK